jgi:hypothetical protein
VHCCPALVLIQSEAADSGADPREVGGPGGQPQGDAGQPRLQPEKPHRPHGVGHLVNLGKYTVKKTLKQKIKLP